MSQAGPVKITTPQEIRPLVDALLLRFHPEAIWLFGSRARGDNRDDSDWDLLMVLPDDCPSELLDPLHAWEVRSRIGVPATVISALSGELTESAGAPNTLAYEVVRDGKLLVD